MPTLKIENARYIVTLDPERRIVADGSMLIEGQRITRVGKSADLADVTADRVIDGRRFLVAREPSEPQGDSVLGFLGAAYQLQ